MRRSNALVAYWSAKLIVHMDKIYSVWFTEKLAYSIYICPISMITNSVLITCNCIKLLLEDQYN